MALGEVTIATQGSHLVAIGHNLRDPEIVKHEPHIDPDGVHEVWHHESLRAFYDRRCEPAKEAYNARARESRQIQGSYLDYLTEKARQLDEENEQIRAANKERQAWNELHEAEIAAGTLEQKKLEKEKPVKRPVYEEIVGVYAQGELELSDDECKAILWQHVMGDENHKSWQERHPGLEIVGIYYHADEPDGMGPHVHIDYVPIAESSRGMAVQNSLEKALAKEGIRSGKVVGIDGLEHLKSAREQWSDAEREHLQTLCEEAGYDVIHPKRGKHSTHLTTAEKRLVSQLEAMQEQLDEQQQQQQEKQSSLDRQQRGLESRAAALAKERRELDEREKQLNDREQQLQAREGAASYQEAALEYRERAVKGREDALEQNKAQLFRQATEAATTALERVPEDKRQSPAAQANARAAAQLELDKQLDLARLKFEAIDETKRPSGKGLERG